MIYDGQQTEVARVLFPRLSAHSGAAAFSPLKGKGMKRQRCGQLGLMLCIVLLGSWIQGTPALAEWGGPPGTDLFGSADAACSADQAFRGPNAVYTGMYVGGYHPVTGNIANYICYFPITYFMFGAQFHDPTPATCTAEKFQQGWVINGSDPRGCVPPDPPKKENGKPCCPKKECCSNEGKPAAGNPISVASGNKYEEVVDFATAGPNRLAFIRSYNRFAGRPKTQFGIGWRSNFDRSLHMPSTSTTLAIRPDSQELTFTKSGGNWHADTDISAQLTTNGTTWTLTDADDTQEVYDQAGKLLTVTQRNGYQQTLTYNTDARVATVSDTFGRQLTFTYSHGTLATMTTPEGHQYIYRYDKTIPELLDPNRLVSVTYPDETPNDPTDNPSLTYLYEDPLYDHALTGMRDEKGIRVATYAYDSEGRAIMSEHANDAGRVEVAYHSDGTRTVTEASGQQLVYHFAAIQGARKVTQVDRLATATVPAATSTSTYDTNGYLASRTDWKGTLTTYVRDSRGLELSRTDAAGTPQTRSTSTTWHATYHLPTQIVEPNRTTARTYNSQGLVLTRTETDTTGGPFNGQTQAWAYTYTTAGQVATVNGPRTNVSDVTTYTYTSEGYLKTTTNALGQITQVLTHTLQGLPALLRDPNGVETELAYHPRGWLLRMTVKSGQGDATTKFT